METAALSWLTAGLVGLAILALLVITVALLPGTLPLRKASFYCPWARRNVVVRYLTGDGWDSVRLVSCSALEDATAPPCGAPCLREGGPVDLGGADAAVGRATRV